MDKKQIISTNTPPDISPTIVDEDKRLSEKKGTHIIHQCLYFSEQILKNSKYLLRQSSDKTSLKVEYIKCMKIHTNRVYYKISNNYIPKQFQF